MSQSDNNLLSATEEILKPDFVLDHFSQVQGFAKQLKMELTPELIVFASKVAQAAQDVANQERNVKNHAFVQKVGELLSTTDSLISQSEGVAGYHRNGNVATWESFPLVDQIDLLEKSEEIQGYRAFCKTNLLDESPRGTYADFSKEKIVREQESAADTEDQDDQPVLRA